MDVSFIDEFVLDWGLSGKSPRTARDYAGYLRQFIDQFDQPSLEHARAWLSECASTAVRRKRAQALRAMGAWMSDNGYEGLEWAERIRVPREHARPQRTATEHDYRESLQRAKTLRDTALIEVLWSCGLRRSEVANLAVSDVNLVDGYLIVRNAKNRRHRVAPISPSARRALRRLLGIRKEGHVFGMSSNAIRQRLRRLGVPSAHAWRRGWAVHALKSGVSETSVRAVAGWSSSEMVSRYTRSLREELALSEFQTRQLNRSVPPE